GTTGDPKGVMLTHANLLHNAALLFRAMEHAPGDSYVSWLPTFHDMGLMVGVLEPLYANIPVVLMSPAAFLQRPLRWLQAISRYGATTSGGPNFAYDLCARRINEEQKASLDLSRWSIAFNGAEPVRRETLESFAAAFAPCGFRPETLYPCYGLAEATLIVSGAKKGEPAVIKTVDAGALERHRIVEVGEGEPGARALVGCGRPVPGQEVVIVSEESSAECAPEEVGEVWVAGPSVARGYWNRPAETESTFGARLAGTGAGPYLRTGDLGFMHDGELFITGRLKDLIIVRGLNHYPQDIELTVERAHPSLRPAGGAAFSVEAAGEERLVVVQEVEARRRPDTREVIEAVRQAVAAQHEVAAYAVVLVKAGGVLKTSSGKVQRRACRAMFVEGRLEALAEWRESDAGEETARAAAVVASGPAARTAEEIEKWLASLVAAKVVGDASALDVSRPLSAYCLDSLAAIELMHAIETGVGVTLPMVSFLQEQSIAELAAQVFARAGEAEPHVPALADAEPADTHPLSFGQQAMWFLYKLAPESPAYNIAVPVRVRAALDAAALRRAFQSLVDRHASLRTTFAAPDGEPLQRVHPRAEVNFAEADASLWDEVTLRARLSEEAHRPFNLEEESLLRVRLYRRTEREHVLLLVVHHIAADFWSLAVLMHELGVAYKAEREGRAAELPPLRLRYTDYARWQAAMLASPAGEALKSYWERQFEGEPPVLDLPSDRPRPHVQTFKGASEPVRLDADLVRALKAIGQAHGATLYMTLLAAFQVLLARYTGQEEVVVGSPTAGRSRSELTGLVGYFVNPVALRVRLSGRPDFAEVLARVRRTVLSAFAHQDYPFVRLVEQLQPVRDPSRTPLFQVSFVLQKAHLRDNKGLAAFALGEEGARADFEGLPLESMALEQRVAQFDLTLMVAEEETGLAASLQYNTDLFDAATVRRMAEHLRVLLAAIADDPRRPVADLPLMTDEERRRSLVEWNDTAAAYPLDKCIHELIEEQAARTPDAAAVIFNERHLSYRELNEQANRLARHLRARGVGAESLVGVLLPRGVEMVVGIVAVLKAGGAYVPLDPDYPKQRLSFTLKDARPSVLLTKGGLADGLPDGGVPFVLLDADAGAIARESGANLGHTAGADNLAYVIYSSGSTGTPKGVPVIHRGLVNSTLARLDHYDEPVNAFLLLPSFAFDTSVGVIFWTLCRGGALVIPDGRLNQDPRYLARLIARHRVSHLIGLPSLYALLLEQARPGQLDSLSTVVVAGEACPVELPGRHFEALPEASLYNEYGPTEATVWCSVYDFDAREAGAPVSIGRPIANTSLYLLDADWRPVPVGVHGELYIGGEGLARGYLNRPALTAERFIPDPFSEEPGSRLYRTGDVARFKPDGQIEFLGRNDQQVKIRGFRIELMEIEATLEQLPSVQQAVVLAREDAPGGKRLVAYVVPDGASELAASELRSHLRERLPDYMVPAAFVFLEELPLNPSGKVNRRRLPAPDWSKPELEGEFVAARTPVEELLAGMWAELLGLERVGVNDNFFEAGGHSLLATQVVSRLSDIFKLDLPLRTLFESPTVASFAEAVTALMADEASGDDQPVLPVPRHGELPLSFAQQRLWFLDQLQPDSPFYNLSGAIQLHGELDPSALEQGFNQIVRRHEALRTTFSSEGGRPRQRVLPSL
ncbi:MAG TPA: amino acid adenylation domain-containing protein, partial [Pyrinomonadaceae bacterium]|nr:amino acid adenylation domain-containing protein [Pyrinomonadaceae bacterium]